MTASGMTNTGTVPLGDTSNMFCGFCASATSRISQRMPAASSAMRARMA